MKTKSLESLGLFCFPFLFCSGGDRYTHTHIHEARPGWKRRTEREERKRKSRVHEQEDGGEEDGEREAQARFMYRMTDFSFRLPALL